MRPSWRWLLFALWVPFSLATGVSWARPVVPPPRPFPPDDALNAFQVLIETPDGVRSGLGFAVGRTRPRLVTSVSLVGTASEVMVESIDGYAGHHRRRARVRHRRRPGALVLLEPTESIPTRPLRPYVRPPEDYHGTRLATFDTARPGGPVRWIDAELRQGPDGGWRIAAPADQLRIGAPIELHTQLVSVVVGPIEAGFAHALAPAQLAASLAPQFGPLLVEQSAFRYPQYSPIAVTSVVDDPAELAQQLDLWLLAVDAPQPSRTEGGWNPVSNDSTHLLSIRGRSDRFTAQINLRDTPFLVQRCWYPWGKPLCDMPVRFERADADPRLRPTPLRRLRWAYDFELAEQQGLEPPLRPTSPPELQAAP